MLSAKHTYSTTVKDFLQTFHQRTNVPEEELKAAYRKLPHKDRENPCVLLWLADLLSQSSHTWGAWLVCKERLIPDLQTIASESAHYERHAFRVISTVNYQMSNHANNMPFLVRAVDLDPDSFDLRVMLARTLGILGCPTEAKKQTLRASAIATRAPTAKIIDALYSTATALQVSPSFIFKGLIFLSQCGSGFTDSWTPEMKQLDAVQLVHAFLRSRSDPERELFGKDPNFGALVTIMVGTYKRLKHQRDAVAVYRLASSFVFGKALSLLPDPCWGCGAVPDTGRFHICAGCKSARFCTKECQKTAWKRHKNECNN